MNFFEHQAAARRASTRLVVLFALAVAGIVAAVDAVVFVAAGPRPVDAATLLTLPDKLRQAQSTFARTGGLHGAGVFTASGELLVAREDVGRHNAVDKVLGYGFLKQLLPFDQHVLLVSGRASFEIMQKALAARVPIVAAVSAPSSLAVEFAEDSGMTLVGFLREGRMNVYSEPRRVRFS
jgi:FdhD protein